MHETDTKLLESSCPGLLERFGKAIVGVEECRGDVTVIVDRTQIREVLSFLKTDPAFRLHMMLDLFAMDYLKTNQPMPERFAVIYNLLNMETTKRLRVKCYVGNDKPEIDSIHDLYKMANWFEREAWDLFGVIFKGHPNLVRILCHNEFVGHPLRKDYPSDKYQRLKTAVPSTEL